MNETSQFKLPLIEAAQAQKHVTVNEALARLDAASQLRLMSVSEAVPPVLAEDGVVYGVPSGAVNAWDGYAGSVAIFANGGWVFLTPNPGWRAFIVDVSKCAIFDGFDWVLDAIAVTKNGSATLQVVTEFDHVIGAGISSITAPEIKNGDQVIGVTGRILSAIAGSGVTAWDLGVSGSVNRYGNGIGLANGSWIRGLSGSPVTYWSDTALVLTALGGSFSGGTVRLAIHATRLIFPRA